MKKIAALLIATFLIAMPLVPATANALDVNRFLCLGINLGDSDKCPSTDAADLNNPENAVSQLSKDVVNVLSLVVGVVSVVMIIIGGLRYITSSGDSTNVTNAKNTILYAVVGLIIVLFAQVFIDFIVGRFSQDEPIRVETSEATEADA